MKPEFTIDDIFKDSLNLKLEEEVKEDTEIISEVSKKPLNKLIKITKEGIVILDDELRNKVKKKNLSASMVSSLGQCPADWFMDSFILPLISHEEPIYFARGHIFHNTMEHFFTLAKEDRSPKMLSQLAMKVIKKDYKTLLKDLETMAWVKQALQGYLEIGFYYKDVNVAQIVKKAGKEPELGIEIFVKGKLGNTSREVVGFIDRVDRLEDGSLRIVDYKSGGKIYPFDSEKEIDSYNDFGYWRQQLAYTMLLEQNGHKVSEAVLEFPIAKDTVKVNVNNKRLRAQVERDFEQADKLLNKCLEDNLFPFQGHMFCSWCGTLNSDYKISKWSKLNVSLEELTQYVEF